LEIVINRLADEKRGKSGSPIWRCEQHRNLWPEYAVEFALTKSGE
jgi:hypothetical protein